MRILKHNKGNLGDIGTGLAVILTLVLVFFVMFNTMDEFRTNIESNAQINQTNATIDFINDYEDNYVFAWDFGVLFLALMLPIFSFIAAKKIPSKPVFMILVFFVAGFILLGAMITANIYGAMLDTAQFQTFVDQTRFIPIIMPNLVYWAMAYLMLIVYALYTKE